MAKLLTVFGATGVQGGSVVDFVLNDPELSQLYKVRAITRDDKSPKAQQLHKKGVEVVKGDASDRNSLGPALQGTHTVFIMTSPTSFGAAGRENEAALAKVIADVAVEQGVSYIIFSTLPAVAEISGGRYLNVSPFDAKAEAAQYIRTLPVKSAFVSLGSFMQNFQTPGFFTPKLSDDGKTWVIARRHSPKTQFPLLDASEDTGKFVGAILAEPDRYEGRTIFAATALYSVEDIAAAMSKSAGQKIVYQHVVEDDFIAGLTFMGNDFTNMLSEYLSFVEEFGYFGPETEVAVKGAAKDARGRLTTLEEYLKRVPIQL